MNLTQTVEELEDIIRNYITYFIVFDILFFAVLFVSVLLLIRFLKSKKSLKDSNEYLLFTIKGQEEERARIARELHDTIAQDLRYCRTLLEKKELRGKYTGSTSAFGKIFVRRAPYKLQPFAGGYYKKGFKGKSCKPLRFYGTDLRCKIQNLNA